jgi:hypothetical protein
LHKRTPKIGDMKDREKYIHPWQQEIPTLHMKYISNTRTKVLLCLQNMSRMVVGFTFSNAYVVFQFSSLGYPHRGWLISNIICIGLMHECVCVCMCVCVHARVCMLRLQVCNQNCDKSATTNFLAAGNRQQDRSFNK